MDFEFDEEQRLIRESIRRFCQRELDPIADEIDRESRFPMEVYRKAAGEGFVGAMVPQELGGGGVDLISFYIIKEELCRSSAGFGMSLTICALNFCYFLSRLGTEDQKRRFLPPVMRGERLASYCITEPGAGSDSLGIQTRARWTGDHYVIQGSKTFITNAPIADYFIVITRTSGERTFHGGTTFILERGMEGLSTGPPFEKLGMRCSPTSEVFLDGVVATADLVLGTPEDGFRDMYTTLDAERILGAATATGIAQACLDTSVRYAGERIQFGRPIGSFQFIQGMLSEMATNIEVARTFAHKAAWLWQQGRSVHQEAAMAKFFASEVAMKSAVDAVQIHGGYGYIKEFPVERYLRDAKLCQIGGGTSEIQKHIIARGLLKGVTD
jgi:butyryl-CoA dehydrogenase